MTPLHVAVACGVGVAATATLDAWILLLARGFGVETFLRLDAQVGLHHGLQRRRAPPVPAECGKAVQVHLVVDFIPGPARPVDCLDDQGVPVDEPDGLSAAVSPAGERGNDIRITSLASTTAVG